MKCLLGVTAIIETGAGLALIGCPSMTVELLLGTPLAAPAMVTLGRLAGAALLALGLACWLGRGNTQSPIARKLVAAMLLYNFAAVVILGMAGIRSKPVGAGLWPTVALHVAMAAWCVAFLRIKPAQDFERAK